MTREHPVKICPACGRKFVLYTPEWVYKIRYRDKLTHYCSWSCYRKVRYGKEEKEKINQNRAAQAESFAAGSKNGGKGLLV